jgi:thioredoxin-like negative regulator of GroEL
MIELVNDNLNEIINNHSKVFVMFYADWCPDCAKIKPYLQQLYTYYKNITFVHINADESPKSRSIINLTNIPTFLGVFEGNLVETPLIGSKPEKIEEYLQKLVSL